jgi:hypothetical protein
MRTLFLQRQIDLMSNLIDDYISEKIGFNHLFQTISGLLIIVRPYDEEAFVKVNEILFSLESTFAALKFNKSFDEQEFRRSNFVEISKIKNIICDRFDPV